MKNLFCCANGQNHCLAVKEKLTSGLAFCIGNKKVSVISAAGANGQTVIKVNGTNQKVYYRVPGLFLYLSDMGLTSGRYWWEKSILYIENGAATVVNLGTDPINYKRFSFDKSSGLYYSFWSPGNNNDCKVRYSYDGMNYNIQIFNPETDWELGNLVEICGGASASQIYSWWDLDINEMVPDGAGGFNCVFSCKGDRTDGYTGYASFAHSFHLDAIGGSLTLTNDFNFYQEDYYSYPEVPAHYGEPPVYTANGYEVIKMSEEQYQFYKSDSDFYILSTGNVVWDPVSQKYFMLIWEPQKNSYGETYRYDLKLFSSSSLEESTFTAIQTLKSIPIGDNTNYFLSSLVVARQNEYS